MYSCFLHYYSGRFHVPSNFEPLARCYLVSDVSIARKSVSKSPPPPFFPPLSFLPIPSVSFRAPETQSCRRLSMLRVLEPLMFSDLENVCPPPLIFVRACLKAAVSLAESPLASYLTAPFILSQYLLGGTPKNQSRDTRSDSTFGSRRRVCQTTRFREEGAPPSATKKEYKAIQTATHGRPPQKTKGDLERDVILEKMALFVCGRRLVDQASISCPAPDPSPYLFFSFFPRFRVHPDRR